jgi:hypothetical protein
VIKKIFDMLCILFKIRLTYIYHCKSFQSEIGENKFICKEIPGTSSMMNNGIAFDYVDKIYVANPLEKRIRVFKINKDDLGSLQYIKDINIGFGGDNVYYSNKTQELYIGALGQNYHHLAFIKDSLKNNQLPTTHSYKFGAIQVDTKDNDKVKIMAMFSNRMLGVSSAIKLNGKVFISSWADEGIEVCIIEEEK